MIVDCLSYQQCNPRHMPFAIHTLSLCLERHAGKGYGLPRRLSA
jgi:hypothetical protein